MQHLGWRQEQSSSVDSLSEAEIFLALVIYYLASLSMWCWGSSGIPRKRLYTHLNKPNYDLEKYKLVGRSPYANFPIFHPSLSNANFFQAIF
jgi:hypothetical protein